eukprot:50271-Ditylum_brightwellii.AAC.1
MVLMAITTKLECTTDISDEEVETEDEEEMKDMEDVQCETAAEVAVPCITQTIQIVQLVVPKKMSIIKLIKRTSDNHDSTLNYWSLKKSKPLKKSKSKFKWE